MTTLITNDDGDSAGLRVLLKAAQAIDDAYALIPHRQRSAVSKSLTLHKALRIHEKDGGIFELTGTPADCVLFALYSKEFKKPDFVLSGINFGDNTSLDSILSSGTLGACWQALIEGIPAIAFSLARTNREWRDQKNWSDVHELEKRTVEVIGLLRKKMKKNCFYSVNLPANISKAHVIFEKRLQRSRFRVFIDKRVDPSNHPYYWLCGDFKKYEKDTDTHAVNVENNITITEISLDTFHIGLK